VDCKHVAATLLTTRHQLPATPAPLSGWEGLLADVVRPAEPQPAAAQVALQLEVVTAPATRLRLRPVRRGTSGRWVRTGMAWRDLEGGYSSAPVGREQRTALRSIVATFRARQSAYMYGDASIHLDELGPPAWRLLGDAQDAGIALVGTDPQQQVRMSAEPAAVQLDVRRPDPDGDLQLVPGVRVVREPGAPDSRHQPQGRRGGPHPDRGRLRLRARPVVEPGDRGAGR
jgi:hypothetical protein